MIRTHEKVFPKTSHIYLYEIPRESKIHADASDGSKVITFHKLDGMYSYCTTDKGNPVHLHVMTPLKKVENYYIISEK